MLSAKQEFEDNMRPAELLLTVYQLLETDGILTDGNLVDRLRESAGVGADEDIMLIYNEIFIGLVRERARIPRAALKQSALCNLLRQAVVAACTGLDAYLPALLRENLPRVIAAKGREFFPQDESLQDSFKDLTFDLPETLRLLGAPDAPLAISNKIISHSRFKYLSNKKGIHAVGSLLDIDKPWQQVSASLGRDQKELMKIIEDTASRRNDIVHRADRPQSDPTREIQDIKYTWALQAVDTVKHVCLTLDDLVAARMANLDRRASTEPS